MTKRNIQFFRNKTVMGTYTDHQTAITTAKGKFSVIAQDPGLLDGEIVLYRYTINNSAEIHTIVGVVCEKDGSKHIEILGNDDILNGEITQALTDAKSYTDAQIQDLDATVSSEEDKPVVVKITQTDGKITSVEVTTDIDVTGQIEAALAELDGTATIATQDANGNVTLKAGIVEEDGIIKNDNSLADIKLAKVATSGKAEDVSVTDSDNVIAATTVEGALVEIAKEIDAMVMTESSVVALATDGSALNYSNIKQENGQVKITDKKQLIKFNTAYNAENNLVATMFDVTTAVNNTTYTAGTNVTISDDRKINVPLGLAYDSDNKKIYLTQGVNEDAAIIDTIDATAFIKDGMLEKAELVTNPEGQPNGTYIKLTFNTDAEKEIIYINVTSLIDTYTCDGYITVENYTIKHKEIFEGEQNVGMIVTPDTQNGIVDNFGEQTIITVPVLTFDKAGHVKTVNSQSVTISLPAAPTASTITITDTANNFEAENVEGALAELAGDIATAVEGIKNYASIKVGETTIAPSTNADELAFESDGIITIEASESENATDTLTFKHKEITAGELTTPTEDKVLTLSTTAQTIEVPVLVFDNYGHIKEKGTQKYNITIPTQLTSSVAAGNGITVTPNTTDNNTEYKVEVKLNPNTNDMLTVDENGLNLSSVYDCGEYE